MSDTEKWVQNIDGEAVITLTINNSQPIEINNFVSSIASVASGFKNFLEKKGLDGESQIYVTQVKSGSIIVDLVPMAITAFPTIVAYAHQIDQAVDFVEKWGSRIRSLASGVVPEGLSKSDLKNLLGTVEAIARDPDASSTLEAVTFEDGKRQIRTSMRFNTAQAQKAERTISGEFIRLDDKDDRVKERVLIYFTRSDVTDAPIEKRSGEKGVIPEISDRSRPIIYASKLAEDRVRFEARESANNIFKKAFNVDVSIQFKNEKIVAYRILAVHQVIDLPDDDEDSIV